MAPKNKPGQSWTERFKNRVEQGVNERTGEETRAQKHRREAEERAKQRPTTPPKKQKEEPKIENSIIKKDPTKKKDPDNWKFW